MKIRILVLIILWIPHIGWTTHATGNDDSTTASDNASCNASFQADCPEEVHTETVSSSTVAAPIGTWGSTGAELLVLIGLMASAFKLHRTRRLVASSSHMGSRGIRF